LRLTLFLFPGGSGWPRSGGFPSRKRSGVRSKRRRTSPELRRQTNRVLRSCLRWKFSLGCGNTRSRRFQAAGGRILRSNSEICATGTRRLRKNGIARGAHQAVLHLHHDSSGCQLIDCDRESPRPSSPDRLFSPREKPIILGLGPRVDGGAFAPDGHHSHAGFAAHPVRRHLPR